MRGTTVAAACAAVVLVGSGTAVVLAAQTRVVVDGELFGLDPTRTGRADSGWSDEQPVAHLVPGSASTMTLLLRNTGRVPVTVELPPEDLPTRLRVRSLRLADAPADPVRLRPGERRQVVVDVYPFPCRAEERDISLTMSELRLRIRGLGTRERWVSLPVQLRRSCP